VAERQFGKDLADDGLNEPDSVGDILILIGGVKVNFEGDAILLSKET